MIGFYLLALIAIWLLVGWGIYRVWRRWQPSETKQKILRISIGVLLFAIWFGGAFWEVAGKKMYWDAKVLELCAKDGGVKVYETVELTPNLLDWAGRISIPSKSKATAEDYYFYEMEDQYLRKKNPKIIRTRTVIIRRSDNKILGESIRYGRGGGDLPGPWEASNYNCPTISKDNIGIENQIFIKGGE